ncbi:unnamed protein product (macronuclear) [Paramecium tetraurelia]|uniref:FHA domain containing protein n=1 Tax=Paramecium tetraurelia TaxID=5888 RepID=A0D1G1_PARTE|nr:uncharacterized protein GSPATT00012402001 [Paramecium tetraurelia]CAK76878.1 unnamed protein product [Paramecium tetraurelia]|eukprot:XP_001444275.1 hypothetical protein (macronuclear) [Paramecium tetraurelia strain d4-2]
MDYETLFAVLPKEPKKWSREDVSQWLNFVGLQSLQSTFSMYLFIRVVNNSIDGSCLELIEENDLIDDLGINSKIVRKKLMHWLKNGLKEYTQHIKSVMVDDKRCDKMEQENTSLENTESAQAQYGQINISHDMMTNYIKNNEMLSQQFQQPLCEIENRPQFLKKQQTGIQLEQEVENFAPKISNELIIQPTEGPQTNFYCIKESGGKIGRHSSNQILILEESISRFHAEIVFQDEDFFIKDIGSTTGTFIKVESKLELEIGMVIELGSNQFEIQQLTSNNQTVEVVMLIIEGLNSSEKHIIALNPQKCVTTVGRKQTADLTFSEDHHLSNIHAKICLIEGRVYLEDMGSTNGSWLRLSKEGLFSQLYPLQNQTAFKIGTTSTYLCKRTTQLITDKNNENSCIICIENDRDALYMPCKHNTACLKCSKNLKDCPICRTKIQDVIRIYKN